MCIFIFLLSIINGYFTLICIYCCRTSTNVITLDDEAESKGKSQDSSDSISVSSPCALLDDTPADDYVHCEKVEESTPSPATSSNSVQKVSNNKSRKRPASHKHISEDVLEKSLLTTMSLIKTHSESHIPEKKAAVLDAEDHFAQVVAATLRRLPPHASALGKVKIQEILFNLEFPPCPKPIDYTPQGYTPPTFSAPCNMPPYLKEFQEQ